MGLLNRRDGGAMTGAVALSLLLHGAAMAGALWLWRGSPPEAPMIVVPAITIMAPGPEAGIADTSLDESQASEHAPASVPPIADPPTAPALETVSARPEPPAPVKTPPAPAAVVVTPALAVAVPVRLAPSPPRKPRTPDYQTTAPLLLPALKSEIARETVPADIARTQAQPEAAALPGPQPPSFTAPGLANPAPDYPYRSRQLGEQGRVVIEATVGADGRVAAVAVKQVSGHGRLDRAALRAVGKWRFRPARRAGKPVPGTVDVPITFRLEN